MLSMGCRTYRTCFYPTTQWYFLFFFSIVLPLKNQIRERTSNKQYLFHVPSFLAIEQCSTLQWLKKCQYVFVFILHKVLQNQNHHRVPTIRDHTDCCLFYFLRRSTISWVPRILSNASTIAMLVALVPAKDLHIFNICRILEKEGELDPWKLIPHLRFRRNVPLVSLPHLEVLSKAEVVGQIQDKVWRTLKCTAMN